MPKLYYASPRDLPLIEPAAGLKGRVVQADHATMVIYDLAPKTIVESHKHEMEQFSASSRLATRTASLPARRTALVSLKSRRR